MIKILKRYFFLKKATIFYLITILVASSTLWGLTTLSESQKKDYSKEFLSSSVRQASPTLTTIPVFIPSKTNVTVIYPTIDSNPVVNCGPFPNSKLILKLKLSECNNYTDCGFLDGKWIPMYKSDCTKKQAEETSKFTQSYQLPQGYTQTDRNIIPRQLTEEDYKKAGYIQCQTLVGMYWFTPEQCEWAKKGDQRSIQRSVDNYTEQVINELNSMGKQAVSQQEAEKRKQECIQNAEQLFNELCNSQKKFDLNANCELLGRETARQKASCI